MELLERAASLGVLAEAQASAAEGRGRLVVVSAEAGGGKTALLRTYLSSADAPRWLWGGCDDLVTPIPFGPLLDLARTADPGLEEALLGGERDRAFTRLLDLLERRPLPVVMVIDDAQWIDQASADTLAAVAQRLDRLPVTMVLAMRPEGLEPDHPAQRLAWRAPPASVDRIELEPLSVEAVARMVDPSIAHRIVEMTGGNPFFVNQLVDSGGELTRSVTDVVRSRASDLPSPTVELLELISVNPTRAEGMLLDRIHPGWEEDIAPAETIRLVEVRPDSVAFAHELARHAFESALLASRRRALHGRVLTAAVELGLSPDRLVHHAAEAGDTSVILSAGPLAVTRARAAGSHREAASHLRRLLEYAELLDPVALAETEEAYSLEAWTILLPEEAEAAARRALTLRRSHGGPPEAIGRNLRRIARVRWFFGDADSAIDLLDEAISTMRTGGEPVVEELATALAYRGLIAGIRGSAADAKPWVDESVALLERREDPRLEALVLGDIGTVDLLHQGDPRRLHRAIALAERIGLHVDVVRGHANLANGALTHRRFDEALGHLATAEAYAADHQVFAFAGLMAAIRAQVLFEMGRWDEAQAVAETVWEHGSFARLPASIVRARLKVRRGDPDATEAITAVLEEAKTTGEAQRIVPALGAAAEQAWIGNRLADVIADLEQAHRLALNTKAPRWVGETAIWLQAAGRLDEVPSEADEFARLMIEGRWDEAAAAWEAAGVPYEAAVCRALADDTETVLTGLAELDRMGAVPMARRTRSRLARMGVERIPRGPRRATASNPAGLTARQMDVLGLVVEGFTNAEIAERLFLSARTVDHHVAAILLKLEVESRRQVRERAAALGLLDG